MKSYLNYVWIFIWTMYFKILELYMNFYLNNVFKGAWTMDEKNFLMILQFHDPFLQSEFILYFSCRVKNVFLTTLHTTIL
jgi:hypothetical protein